jgi:hypothetical protein
LADDKRINLPGGEHMTWFHIFYGVAIVIFAFFLVWRSSRGRLQGGDRVGAFALLGLAALGWLANTFGW